MKSLTEQFGYKEGETPHDAVTKKVGKQAARVWAWLQTEESRANAGPTGQPLKQIDQIASGTGLPNDEVQEAIIALAVNRLLTKITPDGRVAA